MMESAQEIEPEERPDPVLFQDTAIVLDQPTGAQDEDEKTEEIVAVPNDEELSDDTPIGLFQSPLADEDDPSTVELPSAPRDDLDGDDNED